MRGTFKKIKICSFVIGTEYESECKAHPAHPQNKLKNYWYLSITSGAKPTPLGQTIVSSSGSTANLKKHLYLLNQCFLKRYHKIKPKAQNQIYVFQM